MLQHLTIRDFVIVDRLELSFLAGFGALTGETGAGKSILIDALALALGGRGDATLIRRDAPRADISAVFDAPEAAADWLAEFDRRLAAAQTAADRKRLEREAEDAKQRALDNKRQLDTIREKKRVDLRR